MENYEGFADLLSNSVRYGLSNKRAVILWGALYLVAMLIYLSGLVVSLIFHKSIAASAILLLSLIPMLIVSIVLFGYIRRCLKGLFAGDSTAPEVSDIPGMAIDGIKMFVISLEAMVVMVIIYIPFLLLLIAFPRNSGAILVFCLLYPVMLVLIALVYAISTVQWAVFADTGRLSRGLNPVTAIRLIIGDLRYAIVAALAAFVLYLIVTVAMTVLMLLIVTVLLLPFVTIAVYLAVIYILARFYQHATGMSTRPSPEPAV